MKRKIVFPYLSLKEQEYDQNHCFMCDVELEEKNRIHVGNGDHYCIDCCVVVGE